MSVQPQFTCFIIGEGTLSIQCAEILRQREHEIYGFISPDPLVKQWATERGIPFLEPTEQTLLPFFSRQPFDYLFSIVNPYVLPPAILTLPRRQAINYHDAPLPRYAGVHATSWALMQQEATHGITWHVMTEQVDAGDILKQLTFAIAPDETALTLNLKCYDAAIHAFTELVDELAEGRAVTRAQNLAERTYFPLYQRPAAACVLSWQWSAQKIDAFVRALTFGPYPNPLGLPKLAVNGAFVIAPQLDVLPSLSDASAGTITRITADGITVATATHHVLVRQLLTLEGQPLPITEFAARFGLKPGYKFEELPAETAERLTAAYDLISKHEAFWVKRLGSLLPISLPYKAVTSPAGQNVSQPLRCTLTVPIPAEATHFLAGQQPAWSADTFLVTAFTLYLARLGDAYSFDIGFKAGSSAEQPAEAASFFASHLPLRVQAKPDWRLAQWYQAISTELNLIKKHYTYAGDITARYPELTSKPELADGLTWPVAVELMETLNDDQSKPESELSLVISKESCYWIYDPNLFDEASINRMRDQFTTLLHNLAAAGAETPLWRLSLLPPAEQHRLLRAWNDTRADYPRQQCFHHCFAAQAEQTPDAVAVTYAGEKLTYAELNRRANQLAHHLQALEVKPETLVGICVERSIEMMVGLLGIFKAGGAYLPLDPTYPPERLVFMLSDAQALVLLTQERLKPKLLPVSDAPDDGNSGPRVLCLDTDWPLIGQAPAHTPASDVVSDNLAYVIYTSGSTGKPKGVMISHRGLLNYLSWCVKTYDVAAGQGAPVHSSLGFDLTITGLFAPLLAGRAVTLLPEAEGAEALAIALRQGQDFSLVKLTPAHLELLNQQLQPEEAAGRTRNFIIGGEALRGESLAFWQKHAPATRLINEYGPTETVVGCCIYEVPAESSPAGAVPIGRPIANTQLFVLDRYLQPTPIGVPGQLYIGGDSLARGYLNRPELTAEKFIPHPFSDEPGARLYQTGDLARYRPDGQLEFLGRLDHQVKIRGFRIELGEIETALDQHPAVREAVVLAREDIPGQKRLVAYVVSNVEAPGSQTADLRHFLQTKLPEYMIPSAFVRLKTLPLTSNGKVDRRALPPPPQTRLEPATARAAPRSPLEQTLAAIWSDILGLSGIGIEDDFFALGGHSLLATQLISRLRDAFQVELPLRYIFEARTIARLGEQIETVRWAAQATRPPLVSPTPPAEEEAEREEGEL
jgi:amino acid adenylation domain-containing protein